jgi:hypothetical protein
MWWLDTDPVSQGQTVTAAPSGGEQAALRGYKWQYDHIAVMVYDSLIEDDVVSLSLADSEAGQVDDLALVRRGRIADVHAAPEPACHPVAPEKHQRGRLSHDDTEPPAGQRTDMGRDQGRVHAADPGAGVHPQGAHRDVRTAASPYCRAMATFRRSSGVLR